MMLDECAIMEMYTNLRLRDDTWTSSILCSLTVKYPGRNFNFLSQVQEQHLQKKKIGDSQFLLLLGVKSF